MIKKLWSLVIMALAVCMLSSCLKDNNDDVIFHDDTAVTGFSLGTLKRHLHTTAKDGITDSIYTITYSAKSYAFSIDQKQKLIYNPDSLPHGTDASKIMATITSKNSGVIVLAMKDKANKDSLQYYNPKDTIDFSKPMHIRVYNLQRTAFRDYEVKLNIHRQSGDEISWRSTNYADLDKVGNRRLVENNGEMYLFGVEEGKTSVFKQEQGKFTKLHSLSGPTAYENAVSMNGHLYVLDGQTIKQSADGKTWTTTGSIEAAGRLIGASGTKLYALTADALISSNDNGATWSKNALDESADSLPKENICFVCIPTKVNANTNSLIIIGTRNGKIKMWRKIEENAKDSQNQPWAYYPADPDNKHTLPPLKNLQIVSYDNALLALGGDLTTLYSSKDQGVTWITTNSYRLPEKINRQEKPFAMTADSNNNIYITLSGETTIRTARIARLAWEQNKNH